jgi:hypothetical protein
MTSDAARVWQFDPHLGDPKATYQAVDFRRTHRHRPEIQARFVARVWGETHIRTLRGRQTMRWTAEPGTPCLILGYWSDGTVHLRWPGIRQHYHIDGRFPAWVVAEEDNPSSVTDPHTLPASLPRAPARRRLLPRLVIGALLLLALVAMLLLFVAAVASTHPPFLQ